MIKEGTTLKKNDRKIEFQIWNGEAAVTSVDGENVTFTDQTKPYRAPRNFKEEELQAVRVVAKKFNAQIVQITTSTMQVEERKIIQ